MSKATRHTGQGFTVLELIIVIAIVGILAAIAVPSIARIAPNQRVASDAKMMGGLLQKARLRAATAQKPMRVVVVCKADPCWAEMQSAEYVGEDLDSWQTVTGTRMTFNTGVGVTDYSAAPTFDGSAKAPAGVRYAIIMPDSTVRSDPKPFKLFLYNKNLTTELKPGWVIDLGRDTGRIQTARAEFTVTP
jgi:prepilin-type N-terminal cleavage/methylation domain-containing protein